MGPELVTSTVIVKVGPSAIPIVISLFLVNSLRSTLKNLPGNQEKTNKAMIKKQFQLMGNRRKKGPIFFSIINPIMLHRNDTDCQNNGGC